MSDQSDFDRVWDILEKHTVGMLTTKYGGELRARPMDGRAVRSEGKVYFLTDVRGHKDDEISAKPDVCFTVMAPQENIYLSITARAFTSRDNALARRIWKNADSLWWNGPEDMSIRVLTLEPVTAELWDGPSSKLVAAYEFAKAKITGEPPLLGENRKKTVEIRRSAHH
jgi:general stress protein 26